MIDQKYIESMGIPPGFQQKPVIDAFKKLIKQRDDLLNVCLELQESAEYWSEYFVPIGIVERLDSVIESVQMDNT